MTFWPLGCLSRDMEAGETTLALNVTPAVDLRDRLLVIDGEAMVSKGGTPCGRNTLLLIRGVLRSNATFHPTGTMVWIEEGQA